MKFPWYIWIPRVLIIAVALFMALFSLDVFEMRVSFLQKMLGLLMSNIPSILLFLFLMLTWYKPFWAGYVFLMLGIIFGAYLYIFFKHYFAFDFYSFVLPILICSGIFFVAHFNRIKDKPAPELIVEEVAEQPSV